MKMASLLFAVLLLVTTTARVDAKDLDQALIAYYPCRGSANDVSGNEHHGTLRGGLKLTEDRYGRPGEAFSFDGIDDHIILPSSIKMDRDFSICFWLSTDLNNAAAWPSAHFLIDRDMCFTRSDWSIGLGQNGKVEFNIGISQEADHTFVSDHTIADGTWQHIAIVRSKELNAIFVKGILSANKHVGLTSYQNNHKDIYVGASVCDTDKHLFFEGSIDDIHFYDRALSGKEVADVCRIEQRVGTDLDEGAASAAAGAISLLTIQPNPFRESATIRYVVLQENSNLVSLEIIDELGRSRILLLPRALAPGSYSHRWTAVGEPNGVYICRLKIGETTVNRTMILLP